MGDRAAGDDDPEEVTLEANAGRNVGLLVACLCRGVACRAVIQRPSLLYFPLFASVELIDVTKYATQPPSSG